MSLSAIERGGVFTDPAKKGNHGQGGGALVVYDGARCLPIVGGREVTHSRRDLVKAGLN